MQSNHEGQIMVTAKFPISKSFDRNRFQESLLSTISAEGELYAWKNISSEAGTFKMIAEFADATEVQHALLHCNGKRIKV